MDIKIYHHPGEKPKITSNTVLHTLKFSVLKKETFPKLKTGQLAIYYGNNIYTADSYLKHGGTCWIQTREKINAICNTRELSGMLVCQKTHYPISTGCYEIRTLEESALLARHLSLSAANPIHAELGLAEIFINAIEHGNLEIDYAAKAALKAKREWLQEISRRLATKPYQHRTVIVTFGRRQGKILIKVEDQGSGFDWENYLNTKPQMNAEHGRGLLLAKNLSFAMLTFEGRGNTVLCTLL